MTKNWTDNFQQNFQLPETVDEAVDRLMMIMEDEYKQSIAAMPEYDLLDLHFTLGMAIRNAFGLHAPGSKLLTNCGVTHPDDASGVIIRQLWKKLRLFDEDSA